ncbi:MULTISPECIES: hypothetical protein [unclassified Dietzia]|uniref:hypothetical protein n=1 Tax=Dietzia TaxID=37914 RepID=UPI0015F80354|nr:MULTISPECIES: hypothetical protein [unclassified Dietzia]MBB1042064.1 hypothetical protein [Dietzia sp. Cai40]MBB1043483.1 hypothetical protein [Dietzia sp. DQ11-44]
MLGSLYEVAGSSIEATASLAQDSGSTLVDVATALPTLVLALLWETVFGVAEDLGSTIMPPV